MLLASEREYVALLQQSPPTGTPSLHAEHVRLVAAARERLRRLGLSAGQIDQLPRKEPNAMHSEILAPISGTVVSRMIYEGQYVKEGDKLFEIADFSTMWFQFDAYEQDLAWLKAGQKVAVTTPAVPGKTFPGTVAFIDPNLREMTRSAKIRVELPNPVVEDDGRRRRELFHRLYADAEVEVEVPEVLTVARAAVLSPGSQPVVYVDRGGSAYEQRRVKLGRAGDDLWEVLDGVREGERVVSSGNMLIDAQAQLIQGSSVVKPAVGPGSPPPVPPASFESRKFTEADQKAIRDFLVSAGAISEALSADNLADFNRESPKLHAAMPALLDVFDDAPAWQPLVAKIEANSHLETVVDLAGARKAFLPFSFAVTEFATRLRRRPEFEAVRIYQCPMVNRAIPGAPKVAPWIQLHGPLRNPYFGAEMLDCGEEVKP
jgi:Cu(I)/Ag(I) efflux system membrane fusion protein